ncbi:MAG: DUF882 domain-containing protein [Deltaproteobacteria bacterium]|nr:DUF882 domain-containing protein [Deltaproteobacteria bacterium]
MVHGAVFFLSLLCIVAAGRTAATLLPVDRYFFSGDGSIHLTNAHTNQSARIRYRLPDGTYPAEARQQIDRLFGVPAGSSDHISLRLVSVLDYIEDHYHQPVEIISGYRSPEYNENLRTQGRLAAKTSMHIEGMAADIRMRKVLSAEWFQTLKTMNCCGVGYYHDNSLHVDTGPVRYWDETTSKVGTNISEHNKQMIIRTEQDIHLAGETVELRLARITDYPVGVMAGFSVVQEGKEPQAFSFDGGVDGCLIVKDPFQRTFKWTAPADFHPEGKVQLRLRLCERAYPEMPEQLDSNPLQIQPGA